MTEDAAAEPAFHRMSVDFETLPPLTSPRRALGLTAVGLGLIRLPAGEGYTFTHSHEQQEEVTIVIAGSGEMVIDGERLTLAAGDIIRVSPSARRAIRASDHEPLTAICAGAVAAGFPRDPNARYQIDDGVPHYDDIPPWYEGDAEVAAKNARLKERMERSRARREAEDEG